ncbi:MAG: acyltransferase [Hymenobacteraceae bacterium]|nr:acyltransferase [Hymenobacteraceae bacterium]
MGSTNSLRNNLYRSLGAKSFSAFWSYWNPIFGYYLGYSIFKPLKNYLSPGFALIITFLFCGLIHDAVTTIFRGGISLFFSTWFLLMATGVLATRWLKQDLSTKPWEIRAMANLLMIGCCFFLARYLHSLLATKFQL